MNTYPGERRPQRSAPDRQARPSPAARENRPAAKKRRRKKRRHGSPILLYIMLAAVAVGTVIILCRTVFFGAQSIEVQGESIYSSEEIIAMTGLAAGDNIFSAKTADIPALLTERLPYIKSASVTRALFPARFIIRVEASTAKYTSADGTVLLDTDFKVLDTAAGEADKTGLTVISGANLVSPQSGQAAAFDAEDAEEVIKKTVGAADAAGLSGITRIDVSDPMNILMLYEDRILAVVGSTAEIDYKMTFAKRMFEQEISSAEEGKLDLSWLASGKTTVYYTQGSLRMFAAEYPSLLPQESAPEGE